ncbi:MAG TPA: hypothetical protein DCS04_04540 [Ruminococcaceae bacterium]|nr:hypothetical protein [Oscillospiraceae bacterium]
MLCILSPALPVQIIDFRSVISHTATSNIVSDFHADWKWHFPEFAPEFLCNLTDNPLDFGFMQKMLQISL